MPNFTEYLRLKKPIKDKDTADIDVLNENADVIDAEFKKQNNSLNGKEPAFPKNSGWNLEKTDLTENNSNKLFTAKGALNLLNNLIGKFTEGINSAKTTLRSEMLNIKNSLIGLINNKQDKNDSTLNTPDKNLKDAINNLFHRTINNYGKKNINNKTDLNGIGTGIFDVTNNQINGAYGYGQLISSCGNQHSTIQMYFSQKGDFEVRSRFNDEWTDWTKIWNSKNFDPLLKLDKGTYKGTAEDLDPSKRDQIFSEHFFHKLWSGSKVYCHAYPPNYNTTEGHEQTQYIIRTAKNNSAYSYEYELGGGDMFVDGKQFLNQNNIGSSTLLFSNTTQSLQHRTITLSESWDNFEKIVIVGGNIIAPNIVVDMFNNVFYTSTIIVNNDATANNNNGEYCVNGMMDYLIDSLYFRNDRRNIYVGTPRYTGGGSGPFSIVKIFGINRKNGGRL